MTPEKKQIINELAQNISAGLQIDSNGNATSKSSKVIRKASKRLVNDLGRISKKEISKEKKRNKAKAIQSLKNNWKDKSPESEVELLK